MVIVTGAVPQLNVMMPPAATALTTASEVQLAALPVPTTRVGWLVSTACASAGTVACPLGLPARGSGGAGGAALGDGLALGLAAADGDAGSDAAPDGLPAVHRVFGVGAAHPARSTARAMATPGVVRTRPTLNQDRYPQGCRVRQAGGRKGDEHGSHLPRHRARRVLARLHRAGHPQRDQPGRHYPAQAGLVRGHRDPRPHRRRGGRPLPGRPEGRVPAGGAGRIEISGGAVERAGRRSTSPARGADGAARLREWTVKYMLLIYSNPANWAALPEAERNGLMAEYGTFTKDIVDSGEFVSGDPLAGIEAASTVRVRGGASDVTDGPFVETKEHLAGYYIVDVKDLDRALALAAKIPDARFGGVEVRPVLDMSGAEM